MGFMRARRFGPVALFTLPLIGCYHSSLPLGDRATREGKYVEGLAHYQAVLDSRSSETWDKDRAEGSWKSTWKLRRSQEREKLVEDIVALEKSQEAPEVKLNKAQAILFQLKSYGNVQQEIDRVQRVVESAAEKDWSNVAAFIPRKRYLEAEDRAGRILANPGLPKTFASRMAALRKEAALHFRAREGEAAKYQAARAYFRALAEHFEGQTITAEGTLVAAAKPQVVLQLDAPKGCEGAAEKIRQAYPSSASPAAGPQPAPPNGIAVNLRVSLSTCSGTDTDRNESRTATYFETVSDGMAEVVKYREEKQCHVSTFCNPGVTTGFGGAQYYTSNCRNDTICTPTMVPYTELVPKFKQVPRTMSYVHTYRTSRAAIQGNAIARLQVTGEEASQPLALGKEESDEKYQRVSASGGSESRVFKSNNGQTLLRALEGNVPTDVGSAVVAAVKKRGDVVFSTAPGDSLGRLDSAVRAALLGSEGAEAYLKTEVGFSTVLPLLSGHDPLARNTDSAALERSGPLSLEDVPTPKRSARSFEYESSFRAQVGLGFLSGTETTTGYNETAALLGIRLETSALGWGSHKGFQFIDSFTGFIGLGPRLSTEYKPDQASLGLGLFLDYTAFVGYRTGRLGLFAGVRGQFGIGGPGDMDSFSYSLPFCARGEFRFYNNGIPTVTVCALSPLGSTYTSVEAFLPISYKADAETTFHATLKYERFAVDPTFANEIGTTVGSFSMLFVGIGLGH